MNYYYHLETAPYMLDCVPSFPPYYFVPTTRPYTLSLPFFQSPNAPHHYPPPPTENPETNSKSPKDPPLLKTRPNMPKSSRNLPAATTHSTASSGPQKKNIRNIIPNLARKILSFICSDQSRSTIIDCFPYLTCEQINGYYEFIVTQKNSLGFYIGNKDLLRLWYTSSPNGLHLQIARVLSKHYLESQCVNSILLSRRMKPSLKAEHLRYRRKILRLLRRGVQNQNV